MRSVALADAQPGWESTNVDSRVVNETRQSLETEQDISFARSLAPLNSLGDAHLQELLRNSETTLVFRDQCLFEAGTYDHQSIYLLHGENGELF